MRKIIRIFAWFLAALVLLVAGLVVYLRNADLSRYDNQIEAFLSKRIIHDIEFGDRFDLHFGRTTRVIAEDVFLTNSSWEGVTELVSVRRLNIAFDTWSAISGPFIVEELLVDGIRGRLERTESNAINWVPPGREPAADEGGEINLHRIAFRNVQIDDIYFTYVDAARDRPIELTLDHLTITPDVNDILDLDLSGQVNELPLWADGKLGPWQNLVSGNDISADLDVTLAQASLSVDGTVADFVRLEGVSLDAVLTGPDISRALERLGLPPFASGEFEIKANVQQLDTGNRIRADGRLGDIELFVSGFADRLLRPQQVSHDFRIAGPNAQFVAELFGIDSVQPAPFQISGDYARTGKLLEFEKTILRVGQNAVSIDGTLDLSTSFPDWDFQVVASGPDFSKLGPFAEIEGLPAEAFSVDGRIRKEGPIWQADSVSVVVGENQLTINGQVETGTDNAAEIEIHAVGPDISVIKDFTGLQGIPERPFDIDARVQSDPLGIEILEGSGVFGANRIEISGVIATGRGLTGTDVVAALEGPELHDLALLAKVPNLPSGPFNASGGLRIDGDLFLLDGVDASVGDFQGTASGQVGFQERAGFVDLDISLSGPDTSKLAAVDFLQNFSGDRFNIAGRVRYEDERLDADALKVSIGDLQSEINGSIIGAARVVDLTVSAQSKDSIILRKLAGLEYLPGGDVQVDGKIEKSETGISFSDATLRVGEYRFSADGKLNLTPESNDSDLRFGAQGPSLKELGMIFGSTVLPERDFEVSGQFNGARTGFVMREFNARVGENDLRGRFNADLRGKPQITASLSAVHLDVTESFKVAEPLDVESQEKTPKRRGPLFSDMPLDTGRLQIANLDIEFRADELISNAMILTDVEVRLKLRDGALQIEPLRLRQNSGGIRASFGLVPAEDGYELRVLVEVTDLYAGILSSADQDPSTLPTINGSFRLEGTGSSVSSIMASSNGQMSMRQGPGRVKEMFGAALFKDVLLQVFRTLNPMRRSRDYQELECGIYDVTVKDGMATIDTLAVQTDVMTTVASGRLNLRNEKLDITFRAKPREGIGISLGTVANQFLAVGGTLTSPSISLDAGRTATTTGAAVATGGLSLLARGLWDRLSAEASICEEDKKNR